MAGDNVLEINNDNFDSEVASSDQPVLIDFYAIWCGPCKAMSPIIEELAEKYSGRVKVGKVDADKAPELAAEYGVQGLPTFMIFKGGEKIDVLVGAQSQALLEKRIEASL